MTPQEFQARVTELSAANPSGIPVDQYLGVIVELVESAMENALGHPAHVTLFVGTRIGDVKVSSTLTDDQLLLMLMAFSERMALKHTSGSGPES